MKIEASRHQGQTARNLIKDWLFTLNLFFIIYSMVMLAQFSMGPDSGRLSTLVCKPDPWGKLVCTVKIYGFRKLFRLDFYADDYIGTYESNNLPTSYPNPYLSDLALPWDNMLVAGTSDQIVCAVSIRTSPRLIDFVPPYQSGAACSQAQALVEAAFAGDRSAINIRFNGYSPELYWRIVLLAFASLLFVAQCSVRLRRRRHEKKAIVVAEDKKGEILPGTTDILMNPEQQPAEEDHPVGMGRKRFILFWWAASPLVFAFFVLSSLLNSLKILNLGPGGCFLSIRDYQSIYLHYPITNLIAILPYIILITLGAVLLWQVLRMEVSVSRWWIAAPIMAGIPLLIGLPPAQNCMDVSDLAFPAFFTTSNPNATTGWSWVVYFLLIGFIQWLVLRRKLKYSLGWILIPFLSVFVEVFLLIFLFSLGLFAITSLLPDVIIFPSIICWALIVLVLATIFNLVPGYYLYRLILARRKKLLPDSRGGDEVVAD
jgi:hypothetical protein